MSVLLAISYWLQRERARACQNHYTASIIFLLSMSKHPVRFRYSQMSNLALGIVKTSAISQKPASTAQGNGSIQRLSNVRLEF